MRASPEDRSASLLQLRIVAFALILGPALFLGVAFYLRTSGRFTDTGLEPQVLDILHWVLLALGMGAVTMHLLLPGLLRGRAGGTIESFRVATITRLAASEGAALFGAVCYLLSGRPLGAGVTLAILGFALVLQLPTSDGLDAWLDRGDEQ